MPYISFEGSKISLSGSNGIFSENEMHFNVCNFQREMVGWQHPISDILGSVKEIRWLYNMQRNSVII